MIKRQKNSGIDEKSKGKLRTLKSAAAAFSGVDVTSPTTDLSIRRDFFLLSHRALAGTKTLINNNSFYFTYYFSRKVLNM